VVSLKEKSNGQKESSEEEEDNEAKSHEEEGDEEEGQEEDGQEEDGEEENDAEEDRQEEEIGRPFRRTPARAVLETVRHRPSDRKRPLQDGKLWGNGRLFTAESLPFPF
jgi:TATA-binding protein-associated factor Taf7